MANGPFSTMNTGIMDPNVMRLYNPELFASQFGFTLPQIPAPSLPPVPFQPQITPGGNRPDQFDAGTFNPNLLGQYVGYFNPAFPAAPGATGSPQNINDFMSSTAPTSVVGDELSFTPIGTDIQQQDDENVFGLANLLSLSPTFRFFTQAVPEIVSNVVDAFTTKDTDPDGKPDTPTPDPAMDIKEQYAANQFTTEPETSGQGPQNGNGKDGPKGCFVKGTMIQMLDGTEKEITTIKVGEETRGGTVQAKMEFEPQVIYNYMGVEVSGSHWVIEDNQFVAVEDSKRGIRTDKIEPVYTFKTSNNRIWIKDIEFGDFETGSDDDWEPHFEMVRQKLNKQLNGNI